MQVTNIIQSIVNSTVAFRLTKADFKWHFLSLGITILCEGEGDSIQKNIHKQQKQVDS